VGIKVLHLLTQLNAKDRFYFVASKIVFMLLRRRHQEVCRRKADNALTGENASRGTRTFSNGTYVGDIVDNMMHGQGIYTLLDGKKYAPVFIN
jgi:hypothetical protein